MITRHKQQSRMMNRHCRICTNDTLLCNRLLSKRLPRPDYNTLSTNGRPHDTPIRTHHIKLIRLLSNVIHHLPLLHLPNLQSIRDPIDKLSIQLLQSLNFPNSISHPLISPHRPQRQYLPKCHFMNPPQITRISITGLSRPPPGRTTHAICRGRTIVQQAQFTKALSRPLGHSYYLAHAVVWIGVAVFNASFFEDVEVIPHFSGT
mmetsp:Transcript_14639/g.31518  ORF Transcript_14639/g.31518 Transcript_14639/m.31518 type:complete len:205 (+) Transcript_14639:1030-1644(+)